MRPRAVRPVEVASVISVTRLDGSKFFLNSDLIESIESTPDTVLTLTSQKKLVVRTCCWTF